MNNFSQVTGAGLSSLQQRRSVTAGGERLSILLVSHNEMRHLGPCLESICRYAPPDTQVVLVDNASTDGSIELAETRFPWVQVVRSGLNLGFPRGTNLAGKHARGKFLLLLNADTLLLEPIAPVVNWLENHPAHGAVTINMLDRSRNASACTGRFPSVLRLVMLRSMLIPPSRYGAEEAYDVDWVQGSFLLIRADLWRTLGGLDERLFMYGDDVDVCKRIWDAGFRCAFLPQRRYLHWGGSNPSKFPDQVRGFATYAERHMTGLLRALSLAVLFGGCLLRVPFYRAKAVLYRSESDRIKAMSSWRAFKALLRTQA